VGRVWAGVGGRVAIVLLETKWPDDQVGMVTQPWLLVQAVWGSHRSL